MGRLIGFLRDYKFHILIFFISLFIITRFNFDPDLGWHIAIGQHFLQTGEIIKNDQFSWTMPGYLWGNYFLFDIFVAFLIFNFGFLNAVLIFDFIASLAVLILLPRKMDLWKFLVCILGVFLAHFNLGLRPSTLSFFIFALVLLLLKKNFIGGKYVILWFFLFAIWVNIHTGFSFGLLFIWIYFGLDYFWKKVKKIKASLLGNLVIPTFCFLGTFISPFNLTSWKAIIFDLTASGTHSIAEWLPTAVFIRENILFAISGLIFLLVIYKNFKKIDPRLLIIGTLIFNWTFLVSNALFFWAAFFIFFASRGINISTDRNFNRGAKIPIYIAVITLCLSLFLFFLIQVLESYNLRNRLIEDKYPVDAVDFMNKTNIGENVFNEYDWGGFIDFYSPDIKVVIDGRMPSWRTNNSYLMSDYLDILLSKCDSLSKYDVKTVLIRIDNKSQCFGNFKKIYQDKVARVLIKAN